MGRLWARILTGEGLPVPNQRLTGSRPPPNSGHSQGSFARGEVVAQSTDLSAGSERCKESSLEPGAVGARTLPSCCQRGAPLGGHGGGRCPGLLPGAGAVVDQVHTFNAEQRTLCWGEPQGIISWEEAEGLSQPGLLWSAWYKPPGFGSRCRSF